MAAALTSTSKVSPKSAVTALLKWRNTKSESQKPDLLDSDELLYLVVTLKKIPPKGRVNAYKIPLPNPLHSNRTEFCLIYDDRPKSSLSKDQIRAKIKAENLPVAKILKYSKLKSDFKAFESKRKLMNSYDMFLADKQIVPLLPRLLGKHFFKKKRIPVPVDLLKKNWKQQIERICGSAMLFLSTGTCCVVRVARSSMTEEEIVENVAKAIEGIVEIVPGNWGGVRSLHLKLLESIALPVYQTVPDEAVKTVEGSEKAVEVVKAESKELKKEKVGKKRGMIQEVRYLDSSAGEAVDEEKSGKDSVGGGKVNGKRKKKVVDESNGKASETDRVDSAEMRKSKRIKEKDGGETKRSKEQMEKEAKLDGEDLEVAEKPTRKVGNPKLGKVKGEDGEKQLNDVASNVEKPLKKSGKVKEDAVVVGKLKSDMLSVKDKKKDVTKKKGDELSTIGGEAVGKKEKRKSEPVKRFKEQMEKKAKLAGEDLEVSEKPTRKVVNPKLGKVKGEDGEKQLKKSVTMTNDIASNVEKPLKKSGKVKEDAVVVGKQKSDMLSVKDKKKHVTKKKGDELSTKGGEAVGKEKRKSEPVKLKSEEAKPKAAKRSKKGAE